MHTRGFIKSILNTSRFGLGPRLVLIVLLLIIESVVHTSIFQSIEYAGRGGAPGYVQAGLHLLFRFTVAYSVFVATLSGVNKGGRNREPLNFTIEPMSLSWASAHVALVLLLGLLSLKMHEDITPTAYLFLATAWILCAGSAVTALFLSLAPARSWVRASQLYYFALLSAIVPALATVLAIRFSQLLWKPTTRITFSLVNTELGLLLSNVYSDADTQILGTDKFRVIVTEACSGMEGLGLIAIFCAAVLWFYRRELRFPRALVIFPVALTLMFFLNSLRIAALVLIGNFGYPEVASVGFHSQAGWIIFSLVALSVAVSATKSSWLNPSASPSSMIATAGISSENPVAPYLVPLLVSIAAGMVANSMSSGFDLFYPLRLIAAALALWVYRSQFSQLNWRFSLRALGVGTAVFVVWILFDRITNAPHPMPEALAHVSGFVKISWICCRAAAAIVTVPIIEELAFRGYLLRVFTSKAFYSVAFRNVRWPALALSSIIFGALHGATWVPGILAGVAYGLLAVRTDRFGEAVAAHATTNALIVAAVVFLDSWQLW